MKYFLYILTFTFISLSAFALYAQYTYQSETEVCLKDRLGNFKWIRERLSSEKPKEKFSFAVIGDTKSRGTFEEIAERKDNFKPIVKPLQSRWLKQYRALVTNASNGAILEAQ